MWDIFFHKNCVLIITSLSFCSAEVLTSLKYVFWKWYARYQEELQSSKKSVSIE